MACRAHHLLQAFMSVEPVCEVGICVQAKDQRRVHSWDSVNVIPVDHNFQPLRRMTHAAHLSYKMAHNKASRNKMPASSRDELAGSISHLDLLADVGPSLSL